jgi:hypothetical protein
MASAAVSIGTTTKALEKIHQVILSPICSILESTAITVSVDRGGGCAITRPYHIPID